ncbi:MAG TPA: TonB-dependent receptor [Candidatus Acidoferrales bacterium]|nr:TonB-dependent receptor [Candidatus Acidoferrales bacterium]
MILLVQPAWAGPTASLAGRVTDSTGTPLANVKVAGVDIETNQVFASQTNRDGIYSLPNLPPGTYRVVVSKLGMRTVVKPGVELHVQDIVDLNFSMQAGSIIESITVPAGAPLIHIEDAMLGDIIGQRAIAELPSLTRNPYDFVVLGAGATSTGVDRGIGFAVNGQRAESGSFLLDGSDNNDAFASGPGQAIPLDAVREYRVQTSNFTAEYGRNAGFIANVVTRGGGNDIHGDAYQYIRNSGFAANTFQNNALGLPRPVFNRNQFGAQLAGPMLRNRLFFFAAAESILVRSSNAVPFYVPTPQLLSVSSPGTQALFRRYPLPAGLSNSDLLLRQVCPYGALCNPGTSPNPGAAAGEVVVPSFAKVSRRGPIDAGAGTPQNTYLMMGRVDYILDSSTTLTGRYAFQDQDRLAVVSQPYSPLLDRSTLARNQNSAITLAHTIRPNFTAESRFVYSRISQWSPQSPPGGMPEFAVDVESVSLPFGELQTGGAENTLQFFHTANLIKGRHDFKFGGQYVQLRDNRAPGDDDETEANRGVFADVQGFVDGVLSSLQLSGGPSVRSHYRYNDFAFFLQDTWKIAPRLTFSPGLRYEYFGEQHSPGREQALDANFYYGPGANIFERIANGSALPTADAPGPYRNHFYLPDRNNFAPRLGLAYDITGEGRTVLRTGAGVFYDRLPGFGSVAPNPPSGGLARLFDVPLTPAVLANPKSVLDGQPIPAASTLIFRKDQNLRTAYTVNWNLSLEHRISNDYVAAASYLGSSGNRLYASMNDNRQGSGEFVGRPDTRLFEGGSSFDSLSNLGHSGYQSLQIKVDQRSPTALGLQFGANYAYSHSIDNLSSLGGDDRVAGTSSYLLDPFNPALDKGSSDFDVRHRVAAYFIWQPPGRHNVLLRGWEFSGILSFQTGQPFSLIDDGVPGTDETDDTRPRVTGPLPALLSGSRMVADALTPNTFLILPLNQIRDSAGNCYTGSAPLSCEMSVNGPYGGTIGRNNYRRPGTAFQNLAVMRNFDLSRLGRQGLKLQFRAEFYNPLNHSNLYVNYNSNDAAQQSFNTRTGTTPGVTASYGAPDLLPQEARQVVLALKILF